MQTVLVSFDNTVLRALLAKLTDSSMIAGQDGRGGTWHGWLFLVRTMDDSCSSRHLSKIDVASWKIWWQGSGGTSNSI
jgi:hypothetical protein